MANTLHIGGGGSITDAELAAALEDELLNLGFSQGGGGIKQYIATLTQSGTDAPVATEIINTLGGTPVWERTGSGQYKMTLAGAFTKSKFLTRMPAGGLDENAEGGGSGYSYFWLSEDEVIVLVTDGDGFLTNTPIKIEIAP